MASLVFACGLFTDAGTDTAMSNEAFGPITLK
jgi:hypothetical protein